METNDYSVITPRRIVTPVEIVARQEWIELHKDLEPQFKEARSNANWHYWLRAWELAAKRFRYKPTFKEWQAAKKANAIKSV